MQILNKLMLLTKPFQMFLQQHGRIESRFTEEYVNHLLLMIRPGDIVGSYESGRPTSILIKGAYDHVAIVDNNLYVVEAIGDLYRKVPTMKWWKFLPFSFEYVKNPDGTKKNYGGVRKVKLEEWIWKKDDVFVVRHHDNQKAVLASIQCGKYVGKDYDYEFCRNNELFCCSEIPYVSFKPFDESFMHHIPEDKMLLPIDYLHNEYCNIMADSMEDVFESGIPE